MARIQDLARNGHFGDANKKLATCDPPLCKACLHGKQHKWPLFQFHFQPLDSSNLSPGDCVSGDQLKSTHHPGMVPTYKGTPSSSTYHTGMLFVGHVSCLLHFTPHVSTGATKALKTPPNY